MPIEYEYDQNLNIVNSRPYGDVSVLEICDYFKALEKDEVKIGFVEIVRFENIKNLLFSSNEAKRIVELYAELKQKKNIRATVLVGDTNLQYEIARMFKSLHDIKIPESYLFIARNEKEAEKFINIVCDIPCTKETIKTAMA